MVHLGNNHTDTHIYKNLDFSMRWAFGSQKYKSHKKLKQKKNSWHLTSVAYMQFSVDIHSTIYLQQLALASTQIFKANCLICEKGVFQVENSMP